MLVVNQTLSKAYDYCQGLKPYACDVKVAAVALTAFGYLATTLSFFMLPLPVCAVVTAATLAGTYKTFTLFEKAYKDAQAELEKAEAEKKAKEAESLKKAVPVTAVPQASFLSRLFGTATQEKAAVQAV
jgi:hypothetical protein